MVVALQTCQRLSPRRPWAFSTLRAWMDLEVCAHTTRKCSEKSRLSEKETPRTSKALTRARPGTGGGMDGKSAGVHGPLTIISQDFDTLRVKLLSEAHREIPSSSTCTMWEWLTGTTRSVSSAYFSNRLMRFCMGL